MCWELGVNSSADPCPLATKPLPVLLLLCFPRMPAELRGSRTTGSAALTFPIIRKRCFLASCKEHQADPWISLDPSFGREPLSSDVEPDLFSQHDPAACRNPLQHQTGTGHQETLKWRSNWDLCPCALSWMQMQRFHSRIGVRRNRAESRKGCDSWEPLAWFPEQTPCLEGPASME
ncbi:uncharacterized protein LOC131584140 isoform X2 [Poecile atricapillus]|uniref:uncharacterized protein LOC131584140 isoform X2 n=1 Tax=Poecile atricapillus TaxID=48891 RepID=UPI0027397849|nr:uncharacterized protein LOC131584140 isoform X2 [Poecile atricapillus]